ncbi:MAG: N(G),N(G)-dimethylarginine dimethylaminohydrolase [Kurthia sp.]|nr:N(G),N(G)-dimethylarginine dimethylaminohydrolase [Candidatus Kurthia equi]
MFNHVIVKKPSKSYVNGLTTSSLGVPNYEELLLQHEKYVSALKYCGVEVIYLEADEAFPDSTFVEDAAVLTKEFAVITNPGAPSRNGEIVAIEKAVQPFYKKIHHIVAPGFLDGGDVLQVDRIFYIGLSERTNEAGAKQLKKMVEAEKYTAHIIPLKEFFHLKTGIASVGKNKLVVTGEFITNPLFESYEKIIIPKEQQYSANCILVNDYVIIPAGFEETNQQLKSQGYQTIELEMSEFQKQDGGLSCLSLRF